MWRAVLVLLGLFLTTTAEANVINPGFETGEDAAVWSFSPTDVDGLGWFASHTDGERVQSTVTKPAAEGNYYASLLQNGGFYDGSALGIGDFGFTGFDRIYATFSVVPDSIYEISFLHAGDDRFGFLADTSVVEIVNADLNTTLFLQTFATPGLFDWQLVTFQFATGSTTNAAIAFTVMGAGNTSGVFDDIQISMIPEPTTATLLALGLVGIAAGRRRMATGAR